ncbi:zinc-binding dehydrogenase [Schaalia canis]|uniref:Zinc-binding dehydrogenase n=2 Tax=Schaalia canis TaxID=100469 RepID=A0A3P1SGW5_9ACTO|nr:zinc-binding dehydrogenase [Schaalia canis]
MNAAVLHRPGHLSYEPVPRPTIDANELLVAIEANTICGTDLRLMDGTKTAGVRPGVILGHEFAGRIAEVGSAVKNWHIGQQVSVSPAVVCGQCPPCRRGQENLCDSLKLFGYEFDGGLAEYVRIPAAALERGCVISPPQEVPAPLLALAEPLSCCLNGQRRSPIDAGMTVLVIGTGPIGLMHCALAAHAGARVIACGRQGRLAPAHSMGATVTTSLTGEDLRDFVLNETEGQGADLAILAVGASEAITPALECVRSGGTIDFFAGFPKGITVDIDPNAIHYREISIVGSANARFEDHRRAVQMIANEEIDLSALVTHTFPLSKLEEAVRTVRERLGLKVALLP